MSPICNDFVRIQSLPKIIILLAISIACWINLKDYFFLFLKKTSQLLNNEVTELTVVASGTGIIFQRFHL